MARVAHCACQQLRVTCEGEPVRISVCHCTACQRRTGSAFGASTRWPKENVRVEGVSTTYVRVADSGNSVNHHFCPTCGTTVWWTLGALPDFVAVALGAFDDPKVFAPKISIYEDRKHAWVTVGGDDVEHIG